MHAQAYSALGRMIRESGADTAGRWNVLDMGGYDVNSTAQGLDIRGYFPAAAWTALDLRPGPGVDIVADAAEQPWPHAPDFDVAVSTELLEHAEHWPAIAENLAAAVTGGRLQLAFVTCAGPGRGAHGQAGGPVPLPGEWYATVDPEDLRAVLERRFREVTAVFSASNCDTYAWARGVR